MGEELGSTASSPGADVVYIYIYTLGTFWNAV
jgi:hypothetical protein